MINIAIFASNLENQFELSQKRYADSVKNYFVNWNRRNMDSANLASTSATPFSTILRTQMDTGENTIARSESRHFQIQPLDTTTFASTSISIPSQGTSTGSTAVMNTTNSSVQAQMNSTHPSSVSVESKAQTKDHTVATVAQANNLTKKTDVNSNLYSYLTGKETPSKEEQAKVDSILNRLSLLKSTQASSLPMQSSQLSSLQNASAFMSGTASEKSLSAINNLNQGSTLQNLLKTVYGNKTFNTAQGNLI